MIGMDTASLIVGLQPKNLSIGDHFGHSAGPNSTTLNRQ